MKKTIGVFAHVDAGKTTFCEALLYLTNQINTPGRVDHQNTLMDHNPLEQRRGITIFSDMASFPYKENSYYLIDTPGHVDFSAEMERTLPILDAAVLIVSSSDGVQSHTITVHQLLKKHRIPTYIFLNKTDHIGTNIEKCLEDVRHKCSSNCYYLQDSIDFENQSFIEWACDYDDALMERYLENAADPAFVQERIQELIKKSAITLIHSGSALKQQGVLELLETIHSTLPVSSNTQTDFSAKVFKVNYDSKGNRVTFFKCLSGSLQLKDELTYDGNIEKVHEIRDYQGKGYQTLNCVRTGGIVGVTGLSRTVPGMGLGACKDTPAPSLKPALRAAVLQKDASHDAIMSCLRRLEEQDPLLEIAYDHQTKEIHVCVMGKIQLEILKEHIREQYGLDIDFGECKVSYKETVSEAVMGYGHYEPLRHYAEVHVRLEPNPQTGIAFESECHTDHLPRQYQNLIRQHLLEQPHKGILTGSSLTDVRFVLTNGAYHLKHTEGGDFREASCRAVRQGLEKANSVLLEPYYSFVIDVDTDYMGRVLSDITRLHGEFLPPQADGIRAQIHGKGPVETFLEYPVELLSFTKGSGAISMTFDSYYPCHDPERIIQEISYEKERDLANTSSSVFCARGAGFEVKWQDAESYMHLLK